MTIIYVCAITNFICKNVSLSLLDPLEEEPRYSHHEFIEWLTAQGKQAAQTPTIIASHSFLLAYAVRKIQSWSRLSTRL